MASRATADLDDPKLDWIDDAGGYVLRLHLQGFNKDDFRVQVNGAGRLTVRGQRAVGADSKLRGFHKVVQLPPAASLDDISGRFEAGVLTLTVPKRAAAPPTTIEELRKPRPAAKDEAAAAAAATARKPAANDEAAAAATARKPAAKDEAAAATARKPAAKDEPAATARKPAANDEPAAAAATAHKPSPKDHDGAKQQKDDGAEKKEATPTVANPMEEIAKNTDLKKEESLRKAIDEAARKTQQQQQQQHQEQDQTLTPPPVKAKQNAPEAATEKAKEVELESLAERARQRAGEAEPEKKKKKTGCGGWKDRVAGELEDMKWVEGLVEMARNNKEVVAVAIAAISLGLFVSHKLYSRK